MAKTLPKMSRKSRRAVQAARSKKTDRTVIFTKADLARQYKAAQRFLALPTVTVGDPKVSETGVIAERRGSAG